MAVATASRRAGPSGAETLGTRHNLALAYEAVGRASEAVAIFEPLLAVQERVGRRASRDAADAQQPRERVWGGGEGG